MARPHHTSRPQLNNPLSRWIIGLSLGMAAFFAAMWLLWGTGTTVPDLQWYVPAVDSFAALTAIIVAILALRLSQILHEPTFFWLVMAFVSVAVMVPFHVLSFSGILMAEEGLLQRRSSAALWFWVLILSALAAFLLATVLARWPRDATRTRWACLGAAAATIVIAVLLVVYFRSLPTMAVDRVWTTPLIGWVAAIAAVFATGAILSAIRCQRTANSFFGYIAVADIVFSFALVGALVAHAQPSLWEYLEHILVAGGFSVLLIGLISEHVKLYRREQEKTDRLEALQRVTEPALAREGLDSLLRSLLERVVSAMGADGGAILLLDQAEQVLVLKEAAGISAERAFNYRMRLGEDFDGRVAAENAVLSVRDVQADSVIWSPSIEAAKIRGMLGVPMRADDMVIGVMHVVFLEPRDFAPDDERLLGVAAERAALAIEEDRLRQELQRRLAEMDATVSAIVGPLLICDPAGVIVRTNAAARQIAPDSLVDKIDAANWIEILQIETAEGRSLTLAESPLQRALQGETVRGVPLAFHPRPGQTIWLSVSAAPIRAPDGESFGAIWTGSDITELKRTEAALRQSEANYRAIFDTANDAIFVHDVETGRILDTNRKASEMIGYSPDEFRRLHVGDFSSGEPPYTTDDALRWIRKAAAGEPRLFEWMVRDRTGRLFWVEVNLKRAVIGGEARLLAIVRDITERKRAQEERERLLAQVQLERNRLQAALETAPIGIVLRAAPDGRPLLFNKAMETIMGRSLARDVDLSAEPTYYGVFTPEGEFFRPEDLPTSRSLRGEVCTGVEALIRQPSGREVHILVNSAPLRDAKGQIIGAILAVQDITLIRQQVYLRDEFLSAAAHELRTPVTTIKGYTQLMGKWAAERGDTREVRALAVIDAQCNRISRRVQEMLETVMLRAPKHRLNLTRFDLGDLAAQAAERMQVVTQSHQLVLVRREPVLVEADRERIEEVLVSLMDNAVKYSPHGGEVVVQVWKQAEEGLVSVTDCGVGISSDRQPHVFEPFYEHVPPGSAGYRGVVTLSLYLAKLIVERHKGRVWFESEVGKGSTFTFALPLAAA